MKHPRLLLCLALLALLAGCASPTAPALPAAPAASSSAGSPPGPDAATPGPDSPAAPGTEPLVPPREPSPPPTEPLVRILEGESPARPTPSYFEPPAEELTLGIVTDAPPAVPAAAGQDRLLYADQTLHVWHVDDARDENLNWPPVAIDCPWLAPDGHTLFFSDQEGAKRVDLRAPEPPQLLVEHFTSDPNEARHRHFCVRGVSDDGQKLLLQASDNHWYQWGVLDQDTDALQVVESPFGPPGEPWYCPGAALWGQDGTLFVSGYSAGRCNQFPGLHVTHWGEPLVPTPVVTSTLPSLAGHPKQMGGAWSLSRSPDGSQVAFWLDEDWAREDGTFLSRALYTVNADASDPVRRTDALPGAGGLPAWSADSQALFYATAEQFDSLDPQNWQIHRLSLSDGVQEVAAELVARQLSLLGPEHGDRLVVLILNDELVFAVHVLDLASGQLTHGPAGVEVLGWLD